VDTISMNVSFSGLQVSRGVSDWCCALDFLYFCAGFLYFCVDFTVF